MTSCLMDFTKAIRSPICSTESVGLASIRKGNLGKSGGFVRRYKQLPTPRHNALVCLAGKAATELVYGSCADGCETDISKASDNIRELISDRGYFGFGMVDVSVWHENPSMILDSRIEIAISAEMKRCLFEAKEVIAKNRDLLEKVAAAFLEKETLLASDIKKLMKSA